MMQSIGKTLEYVVVTMMAGVTAVIIAEVGARTFFSSSLIVSEEIGRYFMIWTAMLAVALVAGDEGHIRVTIATDKLGPKGRIIAATLSDILVIVFLGVLIATSIAQLPRMATQGTVTLGINMAWIYAAMPVGGALTVLFVAQRCVARIHESRCAKRSEGDRA